MIRLLSLSCVIAFLGLGCHSSNDTLTVGAVSGPETDIVKVAQKVALKEYGLKFNIVEFNDYNLPNEALADGSLDANVYQHLPYLKQAIANHHYNFEVIGKTFLYPAAIYSDRIKSLKRLPNRAVIAIPNDPSNEARALLLLQQAGLITLKDSDLVTIQDIVTNPKDLQIKAIDAAQLTHVLPDVEAAVINTTFAIPAGLNPVKDALFTEHKDSPYVNLIVIKKDTPKKEQLKLLVKALNSEPVKQEATKLFGDAALPAW